MKKLLLLIAIVGLALGTQAQSYFRFATDSATVNATPLTTTPFSDSITNLGLHNFTDTVYFGAKINDSVVSTPIDYVSFNATPIDSGMGKRVDIHIPYNNPYFVNGPTGVVIWPIYQGGSAANNRGDSLHLNVIMTGVGLIEAPLAKMYLVQWPGRVDISFGEYQDIVKQVSLYNLGGQLVYSGSAEQSNHIPTAGWSAGVYLCEIQTYKGEHRTLKFVLQ